MPALTLNGYTIPVVSWTREEVEIGDRDRAYSGRAIMQRRAIKSVWTCKTKPLAYSDYESILRMVRGEGQIWGFDSALPTAYYSGSGFGPTTVYGTPYSIRPNTAGQETPFFYPRVEDSVVTSPTTVGTHTATKFGDGTSAEATNNAIRFDPLTTNMTTEVLTATSATANPPTSLGNNMQRLSRSAGVDASWETGFIDTSAITNNNPPHDSIDGLVVLACVAVGDGQHPVLQQ
jgi:hypothetical protein